MTKRMLSLLLALVMTLSLCVPALAADEFEAETVTEVEEQAPEAPAEPEAPEAAEEPVVEEPVEEPEIAAAIAVEAEDEAMPIINAPEDTDLDAEVQADDADDLITKLTAGYTNIVMKDGGTFSSGKKATITKAVKVDLNGKTLKGQTTAAEITIGEGGSLTLTSKKAATFGEDSSAELKVILSGGSLTVEGNVAVKPSVLTVTASTKNTISVNSGELVIPASSNISLDNDTLTINGGTVTAKDDITVTGSETVHGTLAVVSGTLDLDAKGVKISETGVVNVTNGEVTGTTASEELFSLTGGSLNVSGGSVDFAGTTCGAIKADAKAKPFTVNISGGEFTGTGSGGVVVTIDAGSAVAAAVGSKVSISGGTFKTNAAAVLSGALSTNYVSYSISGGVFDGGTAAPINVSADTHFITGGTFAPKIDGIDASYDAAEYAEEDNDYIVTNAVAENTTVAKVFGGNALKAPASGTTYYVVGQTLVENTIKGLTKGAAVVLQGKATITKDEDVTVYAGNQVKDGDVKVNGGAPDTDTKYDEGTVAVIGDNKQYTSVGAAIAALGGSGTIKLVDNITIDDGTTQKWADKAYGGATSISGDVVIDLNNKTVTLTTTSTAEITVTGAKTSNSLTFKGGWIKYGNSTKTKGISVTGDNPVNIIFDDAYTDLKIDDNGSHEGTNSLTLKNESIVDGEIGSTTNFKNVTVDATSTANGTIGAKGGTVTVDGEVNGTSSKITISGNGAKVALGATAVVKDIDLGSNIAVFTVADGAEIKGDVTASNIAAGSSVEINGGTFTKAFQIGNSVYLASVKIADGEFTGTVTINADATSVVDVSGGVFKYANTPISLSGVTKCITGGIFNKPSAALSVKDGVGAAVITDTAKYTAPAESPIDDYNGWTFVGADIAENLAKITKGELQVTAGTLTLSSIGNDIKADVKGTGVKLKMDNVTLVSGCTVTGDKVTELNELIEKAEDIQYNGKLTAAEAKALLDAIAGGKADLASSSAVTNAIADLEDAMEGLEVAPDKAALETAIADAEKLDEDDYTPESWKAADLATAIANAKAVVAKANPTEADIKAAQDALKAATDKLVKKTETPTIPAAPTGGTGFSKADANGDYYYYKNGKYVTSQWVYGKGGLCYRIGADGKMETGFVKVDGLWYFLQTTDKGGTKGQVISDADGWVYTTDGWGTIPGGYGYFINKHNGRYGECTWTKENGDYNRTTGTWSVKAPTA